MVDSHTKPIIGLTGGIGSGKTAVSDWFVAQGIDVIDADVIAHRLTQSGSPILDTLRTTFGDWVMTESGEYNRPAMRKAVFDNPEALALLNGIIHPAIYQECLSQLASTQSPYVILSVPLLIEGRQKPNGNLFSLCHRILVVDVPTKLQLKRAAKRDGADEQQINSIIKNQISRQERLLYADDVVDNSGSLQSLYHQLKRLHAHYLTLSGLDELSSPNK